MRARPGVTGRRSVPTCPDPLRAGAGTSLVFKIILQNNGPTSGVREFCESLSGAVHRKRSPVGNDSVLGRHWVRSLRDFCLMANPSSGVGAPHQLQQFANRGRVGRLDDEARRPAARPPHGSCPSVPHRLSSVTVAVDDPDGLCLRAPGPFQPPAGESPRSVSEAVREGLLELFRQARRRREIQNRLT